MKLGFYVNVQKASARGMHERLVRRVRMLRGLAVAEGDDADVVVALGGDGTILRAVHEFPGKPILGLNLGGLGFLSSVAKDDVDSAMRLLAQGDYRISKRSMLEIKVEVEAEVEVEKVGRGRGVGRGVAKKWRALNDIVFMREMTGHAAILDLTVNGRAATRYLADGLVLATPTGSTAYSLSAGGPVLLPDSRSFVVTPMNPHALGIRPLVVSDSSRFTVTSRARANGKAEKIGVYADGESVAMLEPGTSVEIVKSRQVARLVEFEGYDPYDVLAHKLGWSGTNVR